METEQQDYVNVDSKLIENAEKLVRIAQIIELEERFSLVEPRQVAAILRIKVGEAEKIIRACKITNTFKKKKTGISK
jgi:hypothetical protein